ncbi:MAG: cold shock domain-containing protein [Candidatus Komeilibacteria bacterium]|jgi:cold shock protein|nr:cold shock domain-containing protein [Candidatus Komeilibacteria bacterium]MBT4447499.1 cold shock domain-containing protein [Candidatus Komeilibacteria bacterium]
MNGTIKKLTDKNFGFISPEEGDKDLFFHANELVDTSFEELREGDAVSFEVSDTPKGPAATQVKRV